MTSFAEGLTPPYYAVIFANQLREPAPGYEAMADRMAALAETMPGYLGIESTRNSEGFGITVSYWESESAIVNWKKQSDHLAAQDKGIREWYAHYQLRVARIERAYSGPDGRPAVK
ncbi:antibiotic biosynthesis monooxygenase [Parvularcula flava]|uniref:Antibiotic biosynthesis monooxygenase n=1 Tax=Aquisalinus luteolus TaxID=1566827 RepID=A0A8J3A3V3_9PROT|nr:antibiotic biosynthesis monooxygenase [Aquisalinus luteolus]NHK29339.1 antibiotic biosynthesis monooxygenase [Aquisalinus luteolus]GGI01082.1 polysaccharide biosynthesis protein [Aquisalinus luteolus]